MHVSSLRFLLPLLVALAAPACVSPVEEAARECPCSAGWKCCNDTACYPEGASCPVLPPVPDTTAPDAPRLEAAEPGSPTTAVSVQLRGTSEPGARVDVFAQAACAGAAAAQAQADGNGTFRVTVELTPEATTHFTARALDAAGNTSACGAATLAVVHDTTAPAAPTFTGFTPAAPSRTVTQPVLSGRAEPGAQVVLYADEACLEALPYRGTADAEGVFRIWTRVAPNATTAFHARALDVLGHASPCSAPSPAFLHDDTAPTAAQLVAALPASPSASRDVQWSGRAEPGARVRLFFDTACRDMASPELQADAEGGWTLALSLAANATSHRWSLSVDALGNTSACTVLGSHVHDDVPPAWPEELLLGTSTPGNDPAPLVRGKAEPGARVGIYRAGNCQADAPFVETQADAAGTFAVRVPVDDRGEGDTTLSADVRDAAGNRSGCSSSWRLLIYRYDVTPPAPPSHLTFDHPSPLRDAPVAASLLGRTDSATRVEVFRAADCAPDARVGTSPLTVWNDTRRAHFLAPLTDVAVSPWRMLWAHARDEAGNASGCVPAGALQQAAAGERAWAPQEALAAETVGLGFDGAGRLWELSRAYVPYPAVRLVLRRRDPGGAWEQVRVIVEADRMHDPRFAVSDAGDVLVTWWDGGGTHLARLEAATETWTDTLLEPFGPLITYQVGLAFGPGGHAWACWAVPNASTRCARAAPGEALVVEELYRYPIYQLHLLPGAQGRARALWLQRPDAEQPFEVRLRGFTPGTGWGEVSVAATTTSTQGYNGTQANLATAVGPDGTAWLATGERTDSPFAVQVWHSAPDALDFARSTRLAGGSDRLVPRMAAGAGGEAVVAWSPSGPSLSLVHHSPAEGWSAPTALTYDGPGEVMTLNVACAGPGRAWVYGREYVIQYSGPNVATEALPILARTYARGVGLGPPQLVLDDTLRTSQNWTPIFFQADAEGRVASAQQFNGGLNALRVLE